MESLVEEYLKWRKIALAKTTWERVRWQLLDFVKYVKLKGLRAWQDLRSQDINAFLASKRKRIKQASLVNLIGVLRGIINWLYKEGYFLTMPSFAEELKRGSYHPRFTPSETLTKEMFYQSYSGEFPQRRQAVLELVYSAGLRRSEIHKLNLLDLDSDYLRVIGKGGRERVVPVGKRAQEAVKAYVRDERLSCLSNPNEEALFLSKQGKRLGAHSIALQIPKEIHQDLSLHGLRHACATHMLENGASVVHLQKLLGHERLSTTAIYTKVSTKNLKEMLHKFHPRG